MALSVAPKKNNYDTLRAQLAQMASGANISCKDFTKLLEKLGFNIRPGGKPGHRVVTHPAIQLTIQDGANYNCGHNLNKKILPVYIKKFIRITDHYENIIREHVK